MIGTIRQIHEQPEEALRVFLKEMWKLPSEVTEDQKNNTLVDLYQCSKNFKMPHKLNFKKEKALLETTYKTIKESNRFKKNYAEMFTGRKIFQNSKSAVWLTASHCVIFQEEDYCLTIICYKNEEPEEPLICATFLWNETGFDGVVIHITTIGAEQEAKAAIGELCLMYIAYYKVILNDIN